MDGVDRDTSRALADELRDAGYVDDANRFVMTADASAEELEFSFAALAGHPDAER